MLITLSRACLGGGGFPPPRRRGSPRLAYRVAPKRSGTTLKFSIAAHAQVGACDRASGL